MVDKFKREIAKRLHGPYKKAVLSPSRYLRIVASAGAGKTETITWKIIRYLAEGSPPASVVAFTFTERAGQEMKERIYRRAEELLDRGLCRQLGTMYVGTIHGYCLRILQDSFNYGNYEVLDDNQEIAFLMRHGWDLGFDGQGYAEQIKTFLRSLNVFYDELIDLKKLRRHTRRFAGQVEAYEDLLEAHKLLNYGRMVRLAVEKIKERPRTLPEIRHLVVDEFQDINKAQETLINLLARKATCVVVGDPRQCIYQWRGSDPRCFDRFGKKRRVETVPILKNRRSAKLVTKVGNAVASHFEDRHLRAKIRTTRIEPGVGVLFRHESDADEAMWIARQVRTLVDAKLCKYSDIAILLRSVTTSAAKILDAFRNKELVSPTIPVLVGGRVGLFRRDEARALARLFAWFADMFWKDGRYSKVSTRGNDLLNEALALWPLSVSEKPIRDFKVRLREGRFPNLTSAFQDLLLRLSILALDPKQEENAAILANLGRFNTLLTDYESSIRRGGSQVDWPRDLRALVWFMLTHASGAYEEQPSDDLRGVNAVQIMTVHQAKGLEWPIVFVPALVERRFPSSLMGKEGDWLVPSNLFDGKRYEGGEEDERRLFYVAVTRARDALCLSTFKRIKAASSPSRFLSEAGIRVSEPPRGIFVRRIFKQQLKDTEIVTFAAGEIIEYLRCPYSYRLREIWGFQPGLARELGFGKSLHHILRVIAERAKNGESPEEIAEEVVLKEFHLPFAPRETRKRLMKEARRMIQGYVMAHSQELRSIREVEARLEFTLTKRATITGRVDVVGNESEGIEVRDYKTTDDTRTEKDAGLQLRLYALGLKDLGTPVSAASIALLTNNRHKQVKIEPAHLRMAQRRAENTISGILARKFSPTAGPSCRNCDFCRICRFASPRRRTARR